LTLGNAIDYSDPTLVTGTMTHAWALFELFPVKADPTFACDDQSKLSWGQWTLYQGFSP
jgi:hypothetical protein